MDSEFRKIQDEFKKKYKAGILPLPTIQWHENDNEVDISLLQHVINTKLLQEGFTIICDVNIELLLDQMTKDDASMFRERKLYSSSSHDTSITSILNYWLNNQKLIPPTILIFDEKYIREISPGGIASDEFRPIDGKHRLKVSYYFGQPTLPIMVLKRQVDMIKERLGMK